MDGLRGGLSAKVAGRIRSHEFTEMLHTLAQGLQHDERRRSVVEHYRGCASLIALPVGLLFALVQRERRARTCPAQKQASWTRVYLEVSPHLVDKVGVVNVGGGSHLCGHCVTF